MQMKKLIYISNLAPPSSALIADEMSVGVGDVLTLL
jgi:hypothetical protein